MFEFRYHNQEWDTPTRKIRSKIDSVFLEEIYAAFDAFLRGCGFTLPEECPEDVTESSQSDASVKDNVQEWPG